MTRWALRQIKSETGSLGFPIKACGFSERTSGGYNHSNPTAFGVEDFRDLEAVLDVLAHERQWQYITMMMYYKPWTIKQAVEAGFPFGNSTYYKRLHSAHEWVARELDLVNTRMAQAA